MDPGEMDLLIHGGGSVVASAITTAGALGFSKFLRWRKTEREEDAKEKEREKAEKQRKDDDEAYGLLRDSLLDLKKARQLEEKADATTGPVRDRILRLETRADHFEQLVAGLIVEFKEMRGELKQIREGIREDLDEHQRRVHAKVNEISAGLLRVEVAQKRIDK